MMDYIIDRSGLDRPEKLCVFVDNGGSTLHCSSKLETREIKQNARKTKLSLNQRQRKRVTNHQRA